MSWNYPTVRVFANPENQNFVVTQTVGFLISFAHSRGIETEQISNKREELDSALYTYIATRHLQVVRIEVVDQEDINTAIEWADLLFEWVSADDLEKGQESDFDQSRKDAMKQLQGLNPFPSSTEYRVLLGIASENDLGQAPPSIDGWVKTTPRSPPESADVQDKDRQCDLTWYEHIL